MPEDAMRISSAELEVIVERLRTEIGADWVRRQSARPKGKSLPLVEWFGELEHAPRDEWSKHEVATVLASLSRSIDYLRTARIVGVEDRIAELRSDDPARFYSARQELKTAAEYLSLGCKVEFIPTSTTQRPDLLVDGEVEVECKYKIRDSPIDIQRYQLYDFLLGRTRDAVKKSSRNVDLDVQAIFREEPQRTDVDELIAVVSRATRDSSFMSETRDHGKFAYRVLTRSPARKSDTWLSISRAWAEKYDYVISSGSAMPTEHGLVTKDVFRLGAKCEVVQDRLRSLQRSVDKARKQFSGTRPAVVQIEVTSALPTFAYAEAEYRQKIVDDFLRNNTAISALILQHDRIEMTSEMAATTRRLEIWWNRSARFPMPAALRSRLEEQRVELSH